MHVEKKEDKYPCWKKSAQSKLKTENLSKSVTTIW